MQKLRLLFIALGFFFLIPLGLFASYRLGAFRIEKVEVSLEGSSDPALVEYSKRLEENLSRYRGVNFWQVSIEDIADQVKSEKWVKEFQVSRRFPSGIRVSCVPVKTVGVWVQDRSLRPVSETGDLLSDVTFSQAPRLPIIKESKWTSSSITRQRMARALAELPSDSRVSLNQLAEVEIDKGGDIWLQHLRTGSRIRLGAENVSLQAARVDKVLEYLEHNDLAGREIDAGYSKKVLVKLQTASKALAGGLKK